MQRATSSRKTFTAFYSAVATALPGSAASQVPRSYPHHQRPQLRDLHRDHAVQGDGMKLLTHNMMKSHVKGISNGYPLIIRVSIVDSYTKDTHSHSQRSQLTYSNLFDGSIFDRKWWLHTAVATVRCTYAAPPSRFSLCLPSPVIVRIARRTCTLSSSTADITKKSPIERVPYFLHSLPCRVWSITSNV